MGPLSRPADLTLFDVLRRHAARDPDRLWLTFERDDGTARTWTYGEFAEEVESTRRRLAGLNLGAGDTFVVSLDNHPELIRLILAASDSGTVAVPTDTRLTTRELGDYFDVSQAKVLFARPGHEAAVAAAKAHGARMIAVGDPLDDPHPDVRGDVPIPRAENVFQLLFTSGTTSRPKGVMLTSDAVAHGAKALAAAAGYGPSDVPLVVLPLYHAAAQMHQLWPTLLLGGRAVVVERFAPTRFFAQAVRHGATSSAHFAATLRLLLRRGNDEDATRSGLRHFTFAQTLSSAEFGEWEERFGVPLQQLWGMTETVGLPLMSPRSGDRRLTSVGRSVEGYEVVVRDEEGQPVLPGEPGEILVRAEPGETVALGYYRNPEATAELVDDGWLHSGDMATVDEDGYVYFLGRRRDIIRRAGTNFSALEVEEVVRQLSGVLDVAVVPMEDALGDESVAAFVVRDGDRPSAEEIGAHCRAALAVFKRPQTIEFVPELPRTAVGKVQKHLLIAAPETGS